MKSVYILLGNGLVGFVGGLALGILALLSMQYVELKTPTERQVCRWYIPLAKMAYNLFFRETPAPPGMTNDGWYRKISVMPSPGD